MSNGTRFSGSRNLRIDVPIAPTNVKSTWLSDTSILITWEHGRQIPEDNAQRPVSAVRNLIGGSRSPGWTWSRSSIA